MRTKDLIMIMYGGAVLDVDEQTSVGFSYESDWLFDKAGGKGRSFDLTVPATLKNTKIFVYDREPVMAGVRQSVRGTVVMSGVNLEGVFFLTQYGGERYSLLFVYGKAGTLFDIKGDLNTFSDTIVLSDKTVPQRVGNIPNFGFYGYNNGTYDINNPLVGDPASLFPMANLGYVIDTLAAALGWTLNYPDVALGRAYQAEAYGFTLPTMNVYSEYDIQITGSARNGWSVFVSGGYTLANAGLQIVTRRYKRGNFNENVTVYVFEATKPVRVVLQPGSLVVFASGMGYDLRNTDDGIFRGDWKGYGGCDFSIDTGEWFTAVSPNDWHAAFESSQPKWNGSLMSPQGYTTNISVNFKVYADSDTAHNGDVLQFGLNMPDFTLREYLDAYCNLICACWKADDANKEIDILPMDDLLNHVTEYMPLDDMRVLGIDTVKRYIDGWSRHNLTVCQSEDYVTEENRFKRDSQSENDYLDDEREVAVIPFNEGNHRISTADNLKLAVLEDVVTNPNNTTEYKGVASLMYENSVNAEGALHIQTAIDLGVGARYGSFTREAATVEVRVAMPFRMFAALENTKGATYRGQQYVIASAQWGDGVAKLTLLTLNTDSREEIKEE